MALGVTDVKSGGRVFDADGRLLVKTSPSEAGTTVGTAATVTYTSVNDSNASQTLIAANSARLGLRILNLSTVALHIHEKAEAATLTNGTVIIQPNGYWEMPKPIYTGEIRGIWVSDQSGSASITEVTA